MYFHVYMWPTHFYAFGVILKLNEFGNNLFIFIKFYMWILKLQKFKNIARFFLIITIDFNGKMTFSKNWFKFKLWYMNSAKSNFNLNCTVRVSII